MTAASAKLVDELLALPWEDRIYLADRLLESLNAADREDIRQAWADEAERRVDELDSGEAPELPGEQVFEEIRKRLAR